jgi:hypothetical protein
MPFLLLLILIDVAVRRIAWDWQSTKRMAAAAGAWVRSYTTVRKVEESHQQTLGMLKHVREQVAEQKFKPGESAAPAGRPDPSAKFEAPKGVSGDITQVVGGATNKPVPPPPKKVQPKGEQPEGGSMSGLMAAKKRAQDKIREKEQE